MQGGTQLRSLGQAPATCLLHLSPSRSSGVYAAYGQVWCFEPDDGVGRLIVRQLGPERSCQYLKVDAPVTCLDACAKNNIWLGHADGSVSVRSESQQMLLCPGLTVFDCPVTAIAVDMRGAAWVGSAKGSVKALEMLTKRRQAGAAGITLSVSLYLRGDGAQRTSSEGALLQAPAVHQGPITVMEVYNTRIWSSGGSAQQCSVIEWDMYGSHQGQYDITEYGVMNALLALPLPLGLREAPTPSRAGRGADSPDAEDWAPASAHESGTVVIWSAHEGGCITPASVLHPHSGPARSMAFLDSVGLWCVAYSSGVVMIQPVTCLQIPRGVLPQIQETSSDIFICLMAHEKGLSTAAGTDNLLLTAGLDGSLCCWAEFQLLAQGPAAVSAAALPLTSSASNLSQQMMNLHFSPANGAFAISAVQAALRNNQGRRASAGSDPVPSDGLHAEQGMSRTSAMDLLAEVVQLMRPKSSAPASQPASSAGTRSHSGNSVATLPPIEAASSDKSSSDKGDFQSWASQTLGKQAGMNWVILFDQLTLIRKVAEGSIGQVYLGRYQETDVAVKALSGLDQLRSALSAAPAATRSNMSALNSYLASVAASNAETASILQSLEREVGIMASLRHPNVVLFMGCCLDPPCLVSEWCSRGSVFDVLSRAAQSPVAAAQLTWHRRLHMALDAAKGVYQLHRHVPQILHCDLKSPNLVCDAHWRVKVTDFNLSRMVGASIGASTLVANNPRWQSPEVIRLQHFSTKSDVFSFGVILWELITWKLPWDTMSPFQIINAVTTQHERLDLPDAEEAEAGRDGAPAEASSVAIVTGLCGLISRCWREQPAARPDFPEVISDLRTLLDLSRSTSDAQARRQIIGLHADSPQPSQRRSEEAEGWPVVEAGAHASEGLPNVHRLSGEDHNRQIASGPLTLPSFAYASPHSPLGKSTRKQPDADRQEDTSSVIDTAEPDRTSVETPRTSPFSDMPRFDSVPTPASDVSGRTSAINSSVVDNSSIAPLPSTTIESITPSLPTSDSVPHLGTQS